MAEYGSASNPKFMKKEPGKSGAIGTVNKAHDRMLIDIMYRISERKFSDPVEEKERLKLILKNLEVNHPDGSSCSCSVKLYKRVGNKQVSSDYIITKGELVNIIRAKIEKLDEEIAEKRVVPVSRK